MRLEFIVRLEDSYRFVHDRVQEAAYSLIREELCAEAHFRIGRLLAAHAAPERREAYRRDRRCNPKGSDAQHDRRTQRPERPADKVG